VESHTVIVNFDENKTSVEEIQAALRKAGHLERRAIPCIKKNWPYRL
jgi:copper chaperone CopZ